MFNDINDKIRQLTGGNKNQIIREKVRGETTREQSLTFFEEIFGQEDIKENVFRALISEQSMNILLDGAAATSKTMYMDIIAKKCSDVLYIDCSDASGAGIIEQLYRNQKAKIVIFDEISLLKKNDLAMLMTLTARGRIIKTLKNVVYDFTMKALKVFATTNNILKLTKPVLSRFQRYTIEPYTEETFTQTIHFCLGKKHTVEVCNLIAATLIVHDFKDVRQAILVSGLLQKNDTQADMIRVIENWINRVKMQAVDYT